jgi:hypothetical protein
MTFRLHEIAEYWVTASFSLIRSNPYRVYPGQFALSDIAVPLAISKLLLLLIQQQWIAHRATYVRAMPVIEG